MRGLNSRYARGWELIARLVRDEGKSFSGREANCCFVNTGGTQFAQASVVAGLDHIDDARASAVVDWDQDGDLDLWITNRTGPRVRYLQNRAGNESNFLSLRLVGTTCNRDAIGSRVEIRLLKDGRPRQQIRTLHAGDGFLSQSSKVLHFGLGEVTAVERLRVRWPDGKVQVFHGVQANRHYRLVQGEDLTALPRRGEISLSSPAAFAPPASAAARVVMSRPRNLPTIPAEDLAAVPTTVAAVAGSSPFLLNLWQYTCLPCMQELRDFSQHAQQLRDAGVNVVALHLSHPDADLQTERPLIEGALQRIDYAFVSAVGTEDSIDQLEKFHKTVLQKHQGIVFPTSLLIDGSGQVVALYKGPLSVDQLLEDAKLLLNDRTPADAHLPFAGKWYRPEQRLSEFP